MTTLSSDFGLRILFWGDIFGSPGRRAIRANLKIRKALKADFVIANGENAAHGFGINRRIAEELFDCGIDVLTTGNHVWDQVEAESLLKEEKRILRPINYPTDLPGAGVRDYRCGDGRLIRVANVMGRVFMDTLHDPWHCLSAHLPEGVPRSQELDALIIDFHGEATAEKAIVAHACDGRASMLVGTHTHIPTADERILPRSTAFQSDVGMCGVYQSIIGVNPEVPLMRMRMQKSRKRMEPAQGDAMLCGVLLQTDPETGLARSIEPVRCGHGLRSIFPKEMEGISIP